MAKNKFAELNDDDACKEIKRVMGNGGYVTVSEVARKLRTTKQAIIDVLESAYDQELDLIVGIRCGGGIAEYKSSEYQIEYMPAEKSV